MGRALLLLEKGFDGVVMDFYVFMDVLGDGLAKRGEFHVDVDEVLMGKSKYFVMELLGGHLRVEEGVEVRVQNDFLLPVLHRLLVFINTHLKSYKAIIISMPTTIIFLIQTTRFEFFITVQRVQSRKRYLIRVSICHLHDRFLIFVQLPTATFQIATGFSNHFP